MIQLQDEGQLMPQEALGLIWTIRDGPPAGEAAGLLYLAFTRHLPG